MTFIIIFDNLQRFPTYPLGQVDKAYQDLAQNSRGHIKGVVLL